MAKIYRKPILIIGLGIIVTLALTWATKNSDEFIRTQRFQHDVQLLHNAIGQELEVYLSLLRSTAGFLAGTQEVTTDEFRNFAKYFKFIENYPGLLGIGFSIKIPGDNTSLVKQEMRAQGSETFEVWPDYKGEQHAVIFLEPMTSRNQSAIGYNMFSEEVRREAMVRARDTGQPAASGKVRLIQETTITKDKQAGFLIYYPFYNSLTTPETLEARRNSLKGFIYSPVRAGDFMSKIMKREGPSVQIAVYDGVSINEGYTLFKSNYFSFKNSSIRHLDFAGRAWTIAYAPAPGHYTDKGVPLYLVILLSGFLVSMGLGGFIFLDEKTRFKTRGSEQKLRRMIDNMAAFVGEIDPEGRLLEINETTLRITGVERKDVIGEKFWDAYWWSYDENVVSRMKNAFKEALDGKTVRFDAVGRTIGDNRLTVDFMLSPVIEDDGRINFLVPSAVDISERVTAEQEQEKAMERLEIAKKASDIAIFDWDLITNEVNLDERGREIWGFGKKEDFSCASFLGAIHPDDRTKAEEIIRNFDQSGAANNFKIQQRIINRKTGKIVYVEICGHVFSDDKRPVRVIGSILDITDHKELEIDLSNENERKSKFLATLSHELRNPLAPISNAFALLGMDAVPEEHKKELIEIGRKSVDHLVRLVNELLDITRITRGKVKLQTANINLITPLKEAIQESEPRIRKKQQSIATYDMDQELSICGDPARLRQVFSNILNNAVKYTPQGSRIEIICKREEDRAVVVVKDNGPGIPEDMLQEIFQIFSQVGDSRNQGESGLGIGLALVKELVEMHGGSVKAENRKDASGAVFTVTLPLAGSI